VEQRGAVFQGREVVVSRERDGERGLGFGILFGGGGRELGEDFGAGFAFCGWVVVQRIEEPR
jgi:hypothetical protein